ncbi:facilitated trehalose transporter Tret1-like isoform X1 [Neodiprion fabricii]|uniref:facilitated trehalose transporter Tret1-like isoform X1 n=3 Tax=Neodiprion fabricii TaxID=2872261 RepID=UPI001ED97F8A|nr:facilitated trehalose transporter Tret1-like isoform X1 [Neodiprion fabricii]
MFQLKYSAMEDKTGIKQLKQPLILPECQGVVDPKIQILPSKSTKSQASSNAIDDEFVQDCDSEMRNEQANSHHPPGGQEGRTHKEYEYSPVPASDSQTANGSDTLQETQFFSPADDIDHHVRRHLHEDPEMTEKGSRLLQYLGSFAGNCGAVATGAAMGWTSPVLPMLKESPTNANNPFGRAITSEEGSWIGSLVAMGAAFGGFGAGFVIEKYGRKTALLASVIPFVIGWILTGTAAYVVQLYIARIFFGFAAGLCFTALPMYVGEIAETPIRGALGSLFQMFITAGLLYSYAIGPYVSYTVLWIACICVPLVFFALFLTLPESPYYYLSKGRKDDAIKSVARLRGKSAAGVQKEVDEMQVVVEEAYRNESSYAALFTVKANFKALLLTCALVFFQQFSGINVVLFYTGDIFNAAGGNLSSDIATIIVGGVMLAASFITPLVVERLGRKLLLIASSIGQTVSMGTLGLYFYLQHINSDLTAISWLPVVSLVVFIATYSFGWGPLAWAVMGELFASDVRSKASSLTVVFCWILAFCITKFYSNIEVSLGNYTAFWIFAVISFGGVFFVYFLLPETKGKSLQQIQDELNGIKHRNIIPTSSSSPTKQ